MKKSTNGKIDNERGGTLKPVVRYFRELLDHPER